MLGVHSAVVYLFERRHLIDMEFEIKIFENEGDLETAIQSFEVI